MKNDGIVFFVSLVLIAGTIFLESMTMNIASNMLRLFSDGFFMSGLLIFLYGAICFIYEGGIFHPFGYIGLIVKERLTHSSTKRFPRYREYVESKQKRLNRNYKFIFSVAILWVSVGFILATL